MVSATVLQLAMLAVATLLVVLSVATAMQRLIRTRNLRDREQREARLRPVLMRVLSDDEPDFTVLNELNDADILTLESIAWQLLSKVRGSARSALVAWLESRGAVERARLRTYARSAVRRANAAERLGGAGVAATSPDVTRLLNDSNAEVRIVAARALGKLGDARAVPALLDSLTGTNAVPTSIVSMALIHVGPSAIEGLTTGLGSRSSAIRGVSAELLGMHGAIGAERWLQLMVDHDPSDEVRIHAAAAVGRIGSPHAVEVLSRVTAPTQPRPLRITAAKSLGHIGGKFAVASLQNLLSDDDELVGQAAAGALASAGQAGAVVLEAAASADGASHGRALDWMSRVDLDNRSRRHRRVDTGSSR